ncbi:MAG TPA: methionyl-tRNA formyltransferase [Stellaceae bacterium]|nr:methionyl-tRNA formyltransferase [Stellaceae bacterium]
MPTSLRLAFMGTPDFSVPILDALLAAGHEVVAAYCQPPRPTGRGHKVQPSPVHARAEALGIPVRHPASLKAPEEQEAFAALGLDVAVVAAYGLILPKAILAAPRLGCINVHASLLPRWRGAAPIQRAILAGDAETGVTIMQMEAGLDTGPMLREARIPIGTRMTASELHDALSAMGARLAVETLDDIDQVTPVPQPAEGVTYAAKLERGEGLLDWREPAATLERKVRALTPWPGVWFEYGSERIKVLAAEIVEASGTPGTVLDDRLTVACGTGALRPTLVQRAGKQATETDAFLRGLALPTGAALPLPR